MLSFPVITFLLIALFWVYHRIKYARKYKLGNEFPGPFSLPIIGSFFVLWRRKPEDNIKFLTDLRDQYGGIVRVWIGYKLAFMVTDSKIAELVLSNSQKYLAKTDLYDFLVPWLGEGLLLSKGKKWHNRRKILTPAFHFKILEQFTEIFNKHGDVLIRQLRQHTIKNGEGNVFNIQTYITLMALDIVCETAMGIEINAQTDKNSSYAKAVHDISHILATRFAKIWQRNEFLYRTFARQLASKQDEAISIMHEFTQKIIRQRRKTLLLNQNKNDVNGEKNNDEDQDIGLKRKMALLDVLLNSSIDDKPLSDTDIQEEVDTFMFEGHDTTTSAISYALYLLSRHKDVQDKLYAEVKQVFGNNQSYSYRNLQELKYIELVIKESMRLYPPVPVIGRKLEEELKISDQWTIPADTNFTINMYHMFRDERFFKQPNEFNPNRFSLDGNSTTPTGDVINPFAYIPFSAGSRNCIGQKFAMLEMKCTISKILLNYELLPAGDEPIPLIELILRSQNGIQLALKPRNCN